MFLDVDKHASPTFRTLLCYDIPKGSPMYNSPNTAYILADIFCRRFTETNFNGVRNYSDEFPWGGRDTRQRDTKQLE